MVKILLLNIPFKGEMLQRDFSCPHTSKADYYWPPIDLVAFSGIFHDQELFFIDGVFENLDENAIVEKIRDINPDYIFTIISSLSFKEDLKIFKKIKNYYPNIKICVSGDICTFEPQTLNKVNEIDFIISDFINQKAIRHILSSKSSKQICPINEKEFSIGNPNYSLFKKYKYSMPYSLHSPIASLITNYGCPFRCKFCNSNRLSFKFRNMEEIIKDMKNIDSAGIKEVYMRDLTFGIPQIEKI